MFWIKEFGKAFSIGALIFIVLGLIRYFTGDFEEITGMQLLKEFLFNQLYSVVLYFTNTLAYWYMKKKYPKTLFQWQNLLRAILANVSVTIVTLFFLNLVVDVFIFGQSFSKFLAEENVNYYYLGFIISMVVVTIFYVFYYYRYRQEKKVKEQKIIAGAASAQFDALKNQLDPHFLFNSLNVLTSLIEENPEAATRFTTALSKVYRYVLEQKNKELVTLAEELKFAEMYMTLIKMRFEDSIVFRVPEQLSNPDAMVVPLSLQLLLENAVKHNMVTPSKKLFITISEENGNLAIQNNYQPKKAMKESTGVGLQNIRKRYYLLTDRPVRIEQDTANFKVVIPLLTQSVSRIRDTQEAYISSKKYARAKKRMEDLKGFYIHLAIYLIMVPVFIFLNVKSGGFPWALFPIVGWGVGISGHAMEVFNYNPFLGKDWEERKIRELMKKDNK